MYLGSMGMYHVGGDVTYCLASNTHYLSVIRRIMRADKGAPHCAQALEDMFVSYLYFPFALCHYIKVDLGNVG